MTTTPRQGAPQVADNSATPGTDCNEQCAYFDMASNFWSIADRDLSAPPGSPSTVSAYLVKATGSGAWAGHNGDIAFLVNGTWTFVDVREGMAFWIEDEDRFLIATSGSAFQEFTGTSLSWKQPVRAKTTAALAANTYNNGSSGIGATLTATANGALGAQDGVTLVANDRLLVANESTAANNGIYVVTQVGDGTHPYILTRATDADTGAKLVNATVKVSEGTAGADTEWQCTTNATITVGTTALTFERPGIGVQDVPIMAAAMTPRTTNGAAAGSSETATNKVMRITLDFDPATNEYAQFAVPMPKSWNEGTVIAKFIWAAATGTAAQVARWGIQGAAFSDNDGLDSAFGTAQEVDDALQATGNVHHSAWTSPMTIAGSPADRDLVVFQVFRNAAHANDTLTGDALLIGVVLQLTMNLADDS
jgi:hypothetical protein